MRRGGILTFVKGLLGGEPAAAVAPTAASPATDTSEPDDPAIYGDDESHPIPFVDDLDVILAFNNGGAELILVIAAPLQSDPRSRARLTRKLNNYFAFIGSQDYADEFGGPPRPDSTVVTVTIHPDSSPQIFMLLHRSKPYAADNRCSLSVSTEGPPGSGWASTADRAPK